MISLVFIFYVFVGLAAIIGAVRGWAKEILVLISALVAIFIIFVFESYVPIYQAVVFPPKVTYTVIENDTCELAAAKLGTSVSRMVAYNQSLTEPCAVVPGLQLEYRDSVNRFWVSTFMLLVLSFFGYQTPGIKLFSTAARREKVRDAVLGMFFGALNGYLVIGSIWWFLWKAGYDNFNKVLMQPVPGTELAETAMDLLARMPPEYLMQAPHIYITIAFAFAFVVIVYV
jgi:uncharacterized membrane protein required for colicin V production